MQETLAAAIPKIMVALGHFANDGEVKVSTPLYGGTELFYLLCYRRHVDVYLCTLEACFILVSPSFVSSQVLLKSFVANLKSSSPTIRRTAASSAVSVCQHSRRTSYFYTWLLNVLLGRSHN